MFLIVAMVDMQAVDQYNVSLTLIEANLYICEIYHLLYKKFNKASDTVTQNLSWWFDTMGSFGRLTMIWS